MGMTIRPRFPKVTFARVVAGTAVLLLLTTGAAYAANQITGANIKNGTVTTKDIKNDNLKSKDIKNNSLKSADVRDESLTGTDILDGTIASADILDDTITADDLASNSVGQLEIQTDGVAATEIADNSIDGGEIVDFQLSNQDVGVLFAQVNADGTLANSSGSVSVIKLGVGQYEVDFARNIASCAFTATVGPSGSGSALGELNVADRGGNAEAVFVDTNDSAGGALDRPFHLIVVC